MKSFTYKNYLITLDLTREGILVTALHDNNDYFKIHYIGYSVSAIVKRIKTQCAYRLKNKIIIKE